MHDAIMETVPSFPETPYCMEGPAVIWNAISIIVIIAVLHTFKGYSQDMLVKEVGELSYANTMWILGSFWEHYDSPHYCDHSLTCPFC
jgi:hypothetical protein